MMFESFDGTPVYLYEWEVNAPRAVVQIVHGMTEHAGRYDAFAKFLNAHGFAVVADDHRGHGKTHPESLGYAAGDMFRDTLDDEAAITDYIAAKYPEAKRILFGFSYGSFLTQSYISRYGEKIDAAVIAGSNYKKDFEVYLGSFVASLGCAFKGAKKPAKLIEKLSFGAYAKKFDDGAWLSIDGENNAAYKEDPFCGFTCSFRFYKDFFHGLKRLYTRKYIRGLNKDLPVFLVSGENDPVGDMGKGVKKLEKFYREKAGMKNVTCKLFAGGRHEFLNEQTGREEKWGTVLAYFEQIAPQSRENA